MTRFCYVAWNRLLFFNVAQVGFKTWAILLPQSPRTNIITTHNYTNKNILFGHFYMSIINASVSLALHNHFITIISKIILGVSKERIKHTWNPAQLCTFPGRQFYKINSY